jgi:hypothetical protein
VLANLQTAYGEASEVHRGASGYFAVLRKQAPKGKKQKLYAVDQLEEVMLAARNAPDTYVSQSSFIGNRSRRISAVASMGCAFVDIDCYKLGLAPDDRLVQQILGCAAQLNLPEPTYVVSSGRGLYVKWLFTERLPAAQLARWQRLQAVLIPLYRALGSDPGVRDAARVLRAVETVNSSADNAIVRVVHATGNRVAFDNLWNAVASIDASALSDLSADRVVKTAAKLIERKVRAAVVGTMTDKEAAAFEARARAHMTAFSMSREPIMLPTQACVANLNWHRFIDLRDLCLMRGGPRKGSRDMSLFWMANFLGLSGVVTPGNLDSEILDLAASFEGFGRDFRPVQDGSMSGLRERLAGRAAGRRTVFRNVEFDPLYTPTNEHLIDLFEISAEEQLRLSTIISDREKLRRADLKVPGRAERREARVDLVQQARTIAAEMKSSGGRVVVTQIAERLGVTRWAVSRLLKAPLNAQERSQRKAERRRARHADAAATGRAHESRGARECEASSAPIVPAEARSNVLPFARRDELRSPQDCQAMERAKCAGFSVSKRREEEGVGEPLSAARLSHPRTSSESGSFDGSSSSATDLLEKAESSSNFFEKSQPSPRSPASPAQRPPLHWGRPNSRLSLVDAKLPDWAYADGEKVARTLTHDEYGQALPPKEVIARCQAHLANVRAELAAQEQSADVASMKRFHATLDKVVARQKQRREVADSQVEPLAESRFNEPTGCSTNGWPDVGETDPSRRVEPLAPFARFVTEVLRGRGSDGADGPGSSVKPSVTNRAKGAKDTKADCKLTRKSS